MQGYSRFQLKLGRDVLGDIARIQACQAVLSPGDILIGDANGGSKNILGYLITVQCTVHVFVPIFNTTVVALTRWGKISVKVTSFIIGARCRLSKTVRI